MDAFVYCARDALIVRSFKCKTQRPFVLQTSEATRSHPRPRSRKTYKYRQRTHAHARIATCEERTHRWFVSALRCAVVVVVYPSVAALSPRQIGTMDGERVFETGSPVCPAITRVVCFGFNWSTHRTAIGELKPTVAALISNGLFYSSITAVRCGRKYSLVRALRCGLSLEIYCGIERESLLRLWGWGRFALAAPTGATLTARTV